jgi:hypothetical protein
MASRAGPLRRLDQPRHDEVALGGGRWADQEGLVGDPRVQCAAVCLRIDGDRPDPELAQRAEDANGDLAAIRDEDSGERGRHTTYSLD